MRELKELLGPRKRDSHKGDYGHVFVLAGSPGLTGAAYLCAQGALLSGSGLVTLGIPESLNAVMEMKLTEVMTRPFAETSNSTLGLTAYAEIVKFAGSVDALVIGPGLSRDRQTQALVRKLVGSVEKPIVLDADGINAFLNEMPLLKRAKMPLVLTPHAAEMARLANLEVGEVQDNREHLAHSFAKEYNVIVVLKGYQTVVAAPEASVYVNKTGNPGMATAGSGDILSGMIGSFIGQKINPFDSAKLAVYLHGASGDIGAQKKGELSLIATDILAGIPEAIKGLA